MKCENCGRKMEVSTLYDQLWYFCDYCLIKTPYNESDCFEDDEELEPFKEQVFEFNSGTTVIIRNSIIEINRVDGKSAAKALFAGRTMGQMFIKTSSISGVVFHADYLLICASGLPSPKDFKISNISDIKEYPNCIVAKNEELEKLYNTLMNLI